MKNLFNKDEVDDIKFESIENILNDINLHPEQYTPWFKIIMKAKGKYMDDILTGKIKFNGFDGNIKNFIV